MSQPTLRQLHYLTELVKWQHFGRAAKACFVTQSTLSAGIQDLESLLSVTLVERTNRKVIVTPLGKAVAERAEHILSLSADLVDFVQNENHPLTGRLRIGIIPTISPFLLPRALPSIRKALPKIQFILLEEPSERLVKQLHAGEIDFALLALPYDIGALSHHVFGSETFWVALPPSHPLAEYDTISLSQLPVHELLLLTEGHCLREHALAACQLPATSHRTTMEGTSLYTLIEMIAGGLGITLVPEMAISSDMMMRADIVVKPLLTSETPSRELGLVWRSSYHSDTLVEQLSQYFADALKP
ncbi:MAG TPA: LysR family transcriptional regulator [Gammaproteobacteria bacterium]|nr:LysR family transcriptional regulator [Gammaproteobacteria bacterium]